MADEQYRIKVDEQFEFNLSTPDLDFVKQSDGSFHILKNGVSYVARVVDADFGKKEFSIEVNGKVFPVSISDHHDLLVEKLGLGISNDQKINDIKAPMPGLVLEVGVKVGQKVQKGDGLLILEAMKMENVIKSAGEGIVKGIHTSKGAAVDKGQLLIEME